MKPIIGQFIEQNPEMEYVLVDIDNEPEVAKAHGVMGVPTFISYVDGKQHTSHTGAMPLAKLKQMFPKDNEEIFKTSDMESAYLSETDAMGREMFWKDAGRP
jgi:thioredoxin-like negative regulator of GroEL